MCFFDDVLVAEFLRHQKQIQRSVFTTAKNTLLTDCDRFSFCQHQSAARWLVQASKSLVFFPVIPQANQRFAPNARGEEYSNSHGAFHQ